MIYVTLCVTRLSLLSSVSVSMITHSCFHCSYSSKNKSHLRRHVKNWHVSDKIRPPSREYRCVLCGLFSASKREDVFEHYVHIHDVVLSPPVSFEFANWEEFLAWKAAIEKEEVSAYVSHTSTKRKDATIYYYRCNRDGYFTSKGKGQRKLKVRGSNKIDGCCPASLSVRKSNDGSVKVKFISSHVGHKNELGRLRLPNEDRNSLARKIVLKMPLNVILNDIRTSLYNEEVRRIHLTRRQDLKNVIRDLKLGDDYVRHSNDQISVEAWIAEMQKSSSMVRLYKPQGSSSSRSGLRDDDFVLIIANDAQLEFLAKWGKDFICVDGTHGTNAYGFELTTILTLDDSHEGFPGAFLISSRSDEEVMKEFFTVLKESLGSEVETAVFMSDMADYYCKAWNSVMPKPKRQLYCSWHVDRAWRKNLSKVKVTEKKTYVYWLLRTILQEPDEKAFARLLKNGLKELESDPDTADFAHYFRREYESSAENWAYCFRKHAGLNCNMHLEAMHKIVKHFYFNGKKIRRLDCALNGLMTYVRDKMFSQIIDTHRGKVSSKGRALRKRHQRSLQMDMVVMKTPEGWDLASKVPMATPDVYSVRKTSKFGGCGCQIKCSECTVCIHEFICTCIDNSIKWNLCKHIHYLCRTINVENDSVGVAPHCSPDGSREINAPEGDLVMDFSEKEELLNHEQHILLKEISVKRNVEDIQKKREMAVSLFEKALSLCSEPEHYDCLIERLKPVESILQALGGSSTLIEKTKVNPAQNVSPQKRFHPIRSVKKTNRMGLPSKEKQLEIQARLLLENN